MTFDTNEIWTLIHVIVETVMPLKLAIPLSSSKLVYQVWIKDDFLFT